MNIIKNELLDGLIVFEPKIFQDSRGLFYESWREKDYKNAGINDAFCQDNLSISHKNVLRGLHYQHTQGQLVTIVKGRVFDVVVDIRHNSKTYGQYYSTILDEAHPRQIYMPHGFAHGFYVLSENAILHYKCTQYYDPSHEGGVLWNDPLINIEWPEGEKIISEKDQQYSRFRFA